MAKKNLGFGYIYQICPLLLLCVWNMFGRFQRLGLAPWNLSTNDVSGKPRDIFQHHDMLVHAGELCMYEKKLSQFQFLFSWNRWVKNLGIYNKKKTLVLWNFYRQFYWIIGMLYSIISVNFFRFGLYCGRPRTRFASNMMSIGNVLNRWGRAGFFNFSMCVYVSWKLHLWGLYTTSVFILKINFFKINRYSNVHNFIWICKHNEIRLRNSNCDRFLYFGI